MDWKLDPHSHTPLHAQVERLLRELIAAPEYRAGALLPDEVGLASRLGVSRNTVRSAIERLVHEGLVERRRGVGTHVTQARVAEHSAAWTAFIDDIEPRGEGASIVQASVVHEAVGSECGLALGLDPALVVLRLDRLLAGTEGPIGRIRSWFHPRVALTGSENFRRPLFDLIERDLGVIPVLVHEDVSAGVADAELGRLLHLKRGSPLLLRRRIVLNAQQQPIEVAQAWYRADRMRRHLRLVRDPNR